MVQYSGCRPSRGLARAALALSLLWPAIAVVSVGLVAIVVYHERDLPDMAGSLVLLFSLIGAVCGVMASAAAIVIGGFVLRRIRAAPERYAEGGLAATAVTVAACQLLLFATVLVPTSRSVTVDSSPKTEPGSTVSEPQAIDMLATILRAEWELAKEGRCPASCEPLR
jgi:hypothetical protein